jgi:hypothetical protein
MDNIRRIERIGSLGWVLGSQLRSAWNSGLKVAV